MRGCSLQGNALREDEEGQVWGRDDVWGSPEQGEEQPDPDWAG